jgi:HK97 family phage portal protein
MSFLARVGHFLGFRNERSLTMSPPQWGVRWLPVYEAGTQLTVDEAFHVSVVWACMDALVKSIAPRPWNVYEVNGETRTVRRDDPLAWLLNTRPNPEMTAIAFREAIHYAAIAWGNGYAEIVRDGANRPIELWPLEPERVVPWRKENTDENGKEGELGYKVMQYTGGMSWVPQRRIFHVKGPASVNGMTGENLLVRASKAIAVAASAQQFSASYFRNGSVLSGVLETDKRIANTDVLDNIRAQWAERYAGPQSSGKPLVLPEGLKWKEIAGDPNRSQLLEARKFQVEEIARYFGVPLQMIQVTQGAHGYGSNIEQLGIAFVRDTLRPWAERFEQEADFKLVSGRLPYRETKIDLSELVQGDLKSQVDAAVSAVAGGLLTINEARSRFGWNHIGADGDVHFLPSTAKTLDQILEPPEPPALPAPAKPAESEAAQSGEGDSGEPLNLVREALIAIYAGAMERYAKRLSNRRADLEKRAPEKVEANLAAERERSLAAVRNECLDADRICARAGFKTPNGELPTFLAAIEQGEPPKLAAERLITMLGVA